MLTTQQVMELYKKNGKNAIEKYKLKVNAYDGNPGAEAAKKESTLRQRFNEAIDSGKWRTNVQRMDPATWKQRTVTKGANALSAAFDYPNPAQVAFLDYWLPKMDALKREVRNMPNATKSERRARLDRALEGAEAAAKARIGGAYV